MGQQPLVPLRGQRLRQRREDPEHRRPEEQRALLPGPERRDQVGLGQVARGVRRHVLDVEVVGDDPVPEGGARHQERAEDRVHGAPERAHQLGAAAPGPREADGRRPQRQQEGGPERELAEQGHRVRPAVRGRPRSGSRTSRARRWPGTRRRGPAGPPRSPRSPAGR